jgi:hypothetical protein
VKPYTRPDERMIHTSWCSFEVFSSVAAHEHLDQDYTKRLFASLEGKVSGVPTMTQLSAL